MSSLQISIFIVVLLAICFLEAYLMEIYKRVIRKDKAKAWENHVLALVLSFAFAGLLWAANIMIPILGLLGAPKWADYIFYSGMLYAAQFILSMQLIKKLSRSLILNCLRSKGIPVDEISKII